MKWTITLFGRLYIKINLAWTRYMNEQMPSKPASQLTYNGLGDH